MKITKSKLKQIIKEAYQDAHRATQRGGPGYKPRKFRTPSEPRVVVDMTGREYPLEELQANLDDEPLATLLRNPNQYFVRLQNGIPTGVGPE